MTEYTPTTEEVRNGYVGPWTGPNPYVSEDERTEFDRWLAEVKADAWTEGVVACINETGMHNPYLHNASNVGLDMPTDTETIEHVGDIVNGYK